MKMRKKRFFLLISFLIISVLTVKSAISEPKAESMPGTKYSREYVYELLKNEVNQKDIFSAAIDLNNGTSANSCVYFASETLRRSGISIPKKVANTAQLIYTLKNKQWKKSINYRELQPGDICFTTDEKGNKEGLPTHTYIFMGWVQEGNYKYAYICDNQAKDYENKVYHIRNISVQDKINGNSKEAFSFFMRPLKSI